MKTGFWLKGGNGKLAGATVYKDKNGDTIMREVVTPSNPKTDKQIIQRILMNTVMNSYSKLKEIVDHSFEGIKAGRDCMAYFMKQNLNISRDAVARMQDQGVDFYDMFNYCPLGLKGFTPNQYQVSMGSLPRVDTSFSEDITNYVLIPALGNDAAAITYGDVIDKLGLQRGDQLTFCLVYAIGNSQAFGANEFAFARVILDPTDPVTHLQAPLDTPLLSEGEINYPSIRNENVKGIRFTKGDLTEHVFAFSARGGERVVGAFVIVSRKSSDDKWLRSTAYMNYKSNVGSEVYSLGECMDAAMNGTPVYAPNEYYLNNAGQGGGTAAATGEDSGAGSGGGTAPAITVQSASIGGQSMVVGTTKVLTEAQGTTFPVEKVVALTLSEASSVATFSVKQHSNGNLVGVITHFEGSASAQETINCAKDTVYDIYLFNGEDDVATGFSFKVTESSDLSEG